MIFFNFLFLNKRQLTKIVIIAIFCLSVKLYSAVYPHLTTETLTTKTTPTDINENKINASNSHDFNISRYIPGDCIGDNQQFQLQRLNFSQHTPEEIDIKRYEWQNFVKYELEKLPNFQQASRYQEKSFNRPMKGRGIISYVNGQTSIDFLTVTIRLLRKAGSRLPVEVYAFSNEITNLQKERILKLSTDETSVKYFEVDDLRNFLPMSRDLTKQNNWHIKVAAIINCGFEEVLALDSDSVPVMDPGFLFDTPEYLRDGSIFWPDYWKTHSDNPVWRWLDMQCVDEFEQESCAMVINKSRSWRALMLMWFWNRDLDSRTFVTTYLHGDKDQFRFSWRATNTSFYMVQNWLSSAGFVLPSMTFCGVAAIQYHPSDSHKNEVLFTHINFLKYNEYDSKFFNSENPMINVIKRYKYDNGEYWVHPEGKEPGTKLSFGHMMKEMWLTKTFFKTGTAENGITYNCVDFVEYSAVEYVPLEKSFASDLMSQFEHRGEWHSLKKY
ncbi:hypothetical protein HK096_008993 [Nowakowskiella sp. JEL0078]|nr:hypothetical protein HK096_008993 [Nowakowskiella sp. JEL0078]